jgi:uncharacterized protein YjbI with pentapeptide repeats
MANQEHLDILKQGVNTWNTWRTQYPRIRPDLGDAYLSRADLSNADLSHADLSDADLSGANLHHANLHHADLSHVNLSGANLHHANLSHVNLNVTDLSRAILTEANLSGAVLITTNLSYAQLLGANLHNAKLGWTIFGDVDLSAVKGLDSVDHEGPSTIGTDTILNSEGVIPEAFLRGAGLTDALIDYAHSLTQYPIYYSCFISYSSKDHDFAERLHADLQSKGVRCWFAPEDMKIGDKIRPRIDEAIRIHEKLLLVLSEHSVESAWVEKEVETAFEKERQQNGLVLFPIRLDGTVMKTTKAWAADIRRTRHIGDFREWKTNDDYQKAFNRLLRALKAESSR